jgi:hypothetical protein
MTSARPSAEVNRLLAAAADRAVAENRRTVTVDDVLLAALRLDAETLRRVTNFSRGFPLTDAVRLLLERDMQAVAFPEKVSGGGKPGKEKS